ncbi:hypothetical protein L1987_05718 [Smallanthus sonchifolius]|uniref:Uncharacterized protein n=1 Tax=Smallanthus sonchifolius TaxID=185202 RepID=A0ACB9JWB1_9ASTR|nr:hypothetical protein L1987_05718 [Smallanthus sonchifolius]
MAYGSNSPALEQHRKVVIGLEVSVAGGDDWSDEELGSHVVQCFSACIISRLEYSSFMAILVWTRVSRTNGGKGLVCGNGGFVEKK